MYVLIRVHKESRTEQAHNVVEEGEQHRHNLQQTLSQSMLDQHTTLCEFLGNHRASNEVEQASVSPPWNLSSRAD